MIRDAARTAVALRQVERELERLKEKGAEEERAKIEFHESRAANLDRQVRELRRERNALLAGMRNKNQSVNSVPEMQSASISVQKDEVVVSQKKVDIAAPLSNSQKAKQMPDNVQTRIVSLRERSTALLLDDDDDEEEEEDDLYDDDDDS